MRLQKVLFIHAHLLQKREAFLHPLFISDFLLLQVVIFINMPLFMVNMGIFIKKKYEIFDLIHLLLDIA